MSLKIYRDKRFTSRGGQAVSSTDGRAFRHVIRLDPAPLLFAQRLAHEFGHVLLAHTRGARAEYRRARAEECFCPHHRDDLLEEECAAWLAAFHVTKPSLWTDEARNMVYGAITQYGARELLASQIAAYGERRPLAPLTRTQLRQLASGRW